MMGKVRSGSARIFYDDEILALNHVAYDSKMYHSGYCYYCKLCEKFEFNGHDVWKRFEVHLLQAHPEFIKSYLEDGRELEISLKEAELLSLSRRNNFRNILPAIAKSSYAIMSDRRPGYEYIIIADEIEGSPFSIKDEPVDTPEQRAVIAGAVQYALDLVNQDKRICFVCVGGSSRSPVLACLVAAMVNQDFKFHDYFSKLRLEDETVRKDSDILLLISRMYPQFM
jgi:hypothetical protein